MDGLAVALPEIHQYGESWICPLLRDEAKVRRVADIERVQIRLLSCRLDPEGSTARLTRRDPERADYELIFLMANRGLCVTKRMPKLSP
jgi:hypothetical protein